MSNGEWREPLHALALTAAVQAIAARRIAARALADAQLARIAATEPMIDAWEALDPAAIRSEADRSEREQGSLSGVGIGIKDIIATGALPTTMGSAVFRGHRPASDAEVIARLGRAGGFVFGKTVTTEMAFMHAGKTRNPWDPGRTPGGSSSGSAAAVAAHHVCAALGTQTNGSIVRPAAYCGVVGFKPTHGTIPLDGVMIFSESLDTLGTFTRNVADAAWLANALADPGLIARTPQRIDAPTLGYLPGFPWTAIERGAADALDAALTKLRERGARVAKLDLPNAWRDANLVHRTIMLFEGARNLGGVQARERARLSEKLNAALDEGRAITEREYGEALDARDRAIDAFTRWSRSFDAIVAPSTPAAAPRGLDLTGDPSCCTLWSLLRFPAVSIPIGPDPAGLPLGLQLAAPIGHDDRLLSVAAWCEERLPFVGLPETLPRR